MNKKAYSGYSIIAFLLALSAFLLASVVVVSVPLALASLFTALAGRSHLQFDSELRGTTLSVISLILSGGLLLYFAIVLLLPFLIIIFAGAFMST